MFYEPKRLGWLITAFEPLRQRVSSPANFKLISLGECVEHASSQIDLGIISFSVVFGLFVYVASIGVEIHVFAAQLTRDRSRWSSIYCNGAKRV